MSQECLLSVIIPVYNVEKTLTRCVQSVLLQGLKDYEVLLVDDGSKDNSPVLCDELAKQHAHIVALHKENGGLSDARNYGIRMAKGRFLYFIDSDDSLAKGTLQAALSVLQSANADIVEFPVRLKCGTERECCKSFADKVYTDVRQYWYGTAAYGHCYMCNKIFSARLFQSVRFPKGVVFEDVWAFPSLLRQAKSIATTSQGCYLYYDNPEGICRQAQAKEMEMLLLAQREAIKTFPIDEAKHFVSLINIQLDLYRLSPKVLLHSSDFKSFKGFGRLSWSGKIKFIIARCLSIKILCTIHKLWKSHL